jgi:hypothetical protein
VIIFDLTCGHGHRFEGWFASADDFEQQSKAVLVRCPVCDDASIVRVPSAKVHVGRATEDAPRVADESEKSKDSDAQALTGLPVELVNKLREIVRNTENVGHRFPEEARKIHYEEVPPRPIRGQASKDDADALREEGIDFTSLPPFLTRDPH